MKILIVGGKGTIGKKVSGHLIKKHDVIIAARTSGEVRVDIENSKSIEAMFETVGKVDAVVYTTSAAMVNVGIHSFVKAVSLELKNGMRINVVSSGLVEDAVEKYETYFPGHNPIPMKKVINGYVKSIEGKETGEIIRMYDNC